MKFFNIPNFRFIVFLIFSLVLFSGCDSEEGKDLAGFLVGFIVFLVGTMLAGIPAIILSALSINTRSSSVPSIAIVLTVLYALFFIAEISIFSDSPAVQGESVMIFPFITVAILAVCIVFIVMGFRKRKNGFVTNADEQEDVLDNIINSEEEQELL